MRRGRVSQKQHDLLLMMTQYWFDAPLGADQHYNRIIEGDHAR